MCKLDHSYWYAIIKPFIWMPSHSTKSFLTWELSLETVLSSHSSLSSLTYKLRTLFLNISFPFPKWDQSFLLETRSRGFTPVLPPSWYPPRRISLLRRDQDTSAAALIKRLLSIIFILTRTFPHEPQPARLRTDIFRARYRHRFRIFNTNKVCPLKFVK